MSTVTVSSAAGKPLAKKFEEIFREHYQLVYRTAYGVTGSPEDAEDVLQTIFLRLLRREFPPGLKENPKAYLYRAAVNLSLNTIRARKRDILTNDAELFESRVCASDSTANEEIQGRLLKAIAELNPGAVEVLILRYVHNYNERDIAKMLGTSRGTIAVSLFRSRVRIKKLMRGYSGEKS